MTDTTTFKKWVLEVANQEYGGKLDFLNANMEQSKMPKRKEEDKREHYGYSRKNGFDEEYSWIISDDKKDFHYLMKAYTKMMEGERK